MPRSIQPNCSVLHILIQPGWLDSIWLEPSTRNPDGPVLLVELTAAHASRLKSLPRRSSGIRRTAFFSCQADIPIVVEGKRKRHTLEGIMKVRLTLGLITLCGLSSLPAIGTPQNETKDKDASLRTLAGCLSKGENAGEYKLVTPEGNTWEIKSKTVKLAGHVGHTVTISGKVRQPDLHGAKEKAKEAVDSDAKEHGHLDATDIAMVSDSCKK